MVFYTHGEQSVTYIRYTVHSVETYVLQSKHVYNDKMLIHDKVDNAVIFI